MNNDDFEARMREREYFHQVRLLPGSWVIIRVDGHGFTKFTAPFEKPFDARFRDAMTQTARALLEQMHGIYAYTESDEISVLFRPEWDLFDRGLEKNVSLSAGLASATFTKAIGEAGHFDSRVWLGVDERSVIDYFRWRQADATRCALNGWVYWTLRKAGQSSAEATRALEHRTTAEKNEMLFQHGINFNDLPAWQRRGTGLYTETYEKEGYNPVEGKTVVATRRRVKIDTELPMKEEYGDLVARIMREAQQRLPASSPEG